MPGAHRSGACYGPWRLLVAVGMPGAGLEPAWPCGQGILSPQRLPFRHPGVLISDFGYWKGKGKAYPGRVHPLQYLSE